MVSIIEVTDKAQLRRFVDYPNELYKDVPQFVPATYGDDLSDWDRSKNPAFEYCDARCWLAMRDGEIVGRIGAIHSRKANDKWGANRLHIHEARSRLSYLPLLKPFFELVNLAYAPLYGTVDLSDRQIKKYSAKFAPLINPNTTCFVMDENDRMVAFGVGAPSLASALQKHRGRLMPTGWIDVLKAFHRNDTVDLLLIAVHPDYQKKGVNAIILSKAMKGCHKLGIKQAETGPMLELNDKVQSQWKDFQAEQHKRRRCFIKQL